jgi:hypothetical protein
MARLLFRYEVLWSGNSRVARNFKLSGGWSLHPSKRSSELSSPARGLANDAHTQKLMREQFTIRPADIKEKVDVAGVAI